MRKPQFVTLAALRRYVVPLGMTLLSKRSYAKGLPS